MKSNDKGMCTTWIYGGIVRYAHPRTREFLAKCHNVLGRLFISFTVAVSLMSVLWPYNMIQAANRDTMYFSFDEGSRELKVWPSKLGTGLYPFFQVDQNDFSRWLYQAAERDGVIYGEARTGVSWIPRDIHTFPNVIIDDFDSAQCAAMVVNIYDNVIRTDIKFVISVSIVHADSSVVVSKIEADKSKSNNGKGFKAVVVPVCIVVVAVALVLLTVVFWRRRQKKDETPVARPKTDSLEVVEVVKNEQLRGLDFVKIDSAAYYNIDLRQVFDDTAVHNIFIHHSVVKKMYDFFTHSLESGEITNETGCYFVGCWEYDSADNSTYNISLEEIVEPGDDLEPGEFSFNFGLKIGVKLNSTIASLSQATGRDYVHTVWMHSHPGLGLFLSSHDLLVQRQLAYSDAKNRLVAFVVDTNTPNLELAVFSAKHDGTMNNKEELKRLYSLEELYSWSRKAHVSSDDTHSAANQTVNTQQVDLDNYHALQLNHQGNNRTLNVYLGGSVINAIDDILYELEGKQQLGGFLVGTRDNRGNIVVNECHAIKEESPVPDDALGIFVVDNELDDDVLYKRYFNKTKCNCVFVGRGEDELLILIRDSAESTFPPITDAAACSMKPMKEWLRRKRIYK